MIKSFAAFRLAETAAPKQSAEYNRLRKRLVDIRDALKALEGKTDNTSNTKRAKLLADQKSTRAQKKKLAVK